MDCVLLVSVVVWGNSVVVSLVSIQFIGVVANISVVVSVVWGNNSISVVRVISMAVVSVVW